MNQTTFAPCAHYKHGQPFATLTFGDIRAATCPACLAAEVIALGSVLTPAEIGQAVAFHSGQSATRQPGDDCITITSDLLRNDAAGDRARHALKSERLRAQRERTLRKPRQELAVIRPAMETREA